VSYYGDGKAIEVRANVVCGDDDKEKWHGASVAKWAKCSLFAWRSPKMTATKE